LGGLGADGIAVFDFRFFLGGRGGGLGADEVAVAVYVGFGGGGGEVGVGMGAPCCYADGVGGEFCAYWRRSGWRWED